MFGCARFARISGRRTFSSSCRFSSVMPMATRPISSTAVAGFILICLLASATYMLNDIADLDADRLHHSKRRRPFASGDLPIAFGLIAAPLIDRRVIIGSLFVVAGFRGNAADLSRLDARLLVRPETIASARCFRDQLSLHAAHCHGYGGLGIAYSPWLLSFSWAFFLSLALAKRHVEVARAAHIDVEDVVGRGYRGEDWPLTLSFGIGSGLISIVIMLLYLTNDATPSGLLQRPQVALCGARIDDDVADAHLAAEQSDGAR